MLKNIIIIEGDKQIQCNSEQELVKKLLCENYYDLSEEDKINMLKLKASANLLGNKFDIVEKQNITKEMDVENKFILLDEKTYILSLLMTNNITILEHVDSNIFVKYLDKSKFSKNYIIVNHFANNILKTYLKEELL